MPEPKQELAIFKQIDAPDFKAQLARALPNALSADRMVRLAITMLRRNEALQRCTPLSIMACVVEIAQLGLEPEGVLGHAYMVPFGDQCTLIVGYRGFMHLMYQSGAYSQIAAEVVRAKDKFKHLLGTQRGLMHEPATIPMKKKGDIFVPDDDPDTWRGAYCTTLTLAGASAFTYVEKAKILNARSRSRGWQKFLKEGKSTPWNTDAEEMWKKTAIRRHAKMSQTSTTDKRDVLLRAVMLDEYGERKGLLVPTLAGFEVNPNGPDEDNGEPIQPTIEVSDFSPSTEGAKPEDVKKSPAVKKPAAKSPAANNPAAKPAHDPLIDSKEQTEIYNRAQQYGWKMPEEVRAMLKKRFGNDSIKAVRRSQLPEIFKVLESGT